MVEFAMVFPVAMMLCLGLISASWMFWQSSSMSDGAKAGVRAASIAALQSGMSGVGLDAVPTTGADPCASSPGGQGWGAGGESGYPAKIEDEVAIGADQLQVNKIPLCAAPVMQDDQFGGSITNAVLHSHPGTPTSCSGSNKPIQLRQLLPDPAKVQIYVDADVKAGETLCNATHVFVVTMRTTKGISPPLSAVYPIAAVSKMPVQQP